MFEGANQAAIGHLAGVNAVNLRTIDAAHRRYDELAVMYDRLKARCDAAEAEVQDLRLRLAVAQAGSEARTAVVDAFKAAHPTSPLLVQEGTLKDGSPRRRATSIWIGAFDTAARRMGITNPAAHRIS